MAKLDDRQLAECKGVEEYTNTKGEIRQSYQMELDGSEFSIPESKYFKATKGKFYYPTVFIAERAMISKRTGSPYISRVPAVSWSEVK